MASAAPDLAQATNRPTQVRWYNSGFGLVALIVAARLLLHLLTANRYGIFRDELYYIACSRHLDWGYVDMPPFIPVVTWLFTALFGSSLFVIRLIPAIAGCGAIALTAYQAYQFGGRRFAMALSALAMAVSAVFVINGHLLGTNNFEALFWMGCASIVIRIIQTGNQKLWLWFGVLAGIGLMNKLRAYELQDGGMDTVEANVSLGFAADAREYDFPAQILKSLGAKKIRLLSNNPDKVKQLESAGIRVVERVPCQPRISQISRAYLQTKKRKMGHLLQGL